MKLLQLVLLLAIFGCVGELKIDGTNEKTTKASLDKMKEGMSKDEVKKFNEAVQVITLSGLDIKSLFGGDTKSLIKKGTQKLDGLTVKEIYEKSDKILAERKKREREQALSEISDLEKDIAKIKKGKTKLSNIKVLKSRFYKKKSYLREVPVIDIKVLNKTKQSLSRIYFKGTYSTPGRKVPWFSEKFNYSVPGGMEPGESQKWSLSPNMFSAWGRASVKKGAVFTVEVVGADDHKQRQIASVDELEDKLERLKSLKTQLKN